MILHIVKSLSGRHNVIQKCGQVNKKMNNTDAKINYETKIGRPLKGSENRIVVSVRMEPTSKKLLIDKFGSIQQWIDRGIKQIEKKYRKEGRECNLKRNT